METKGYYASVGFFVLLLSGIGLFIALWLSVGFETQNYQRYLIYFQESVSGLSVSAPVKYNGVDVGFVKKIGIDPEDPNRVKLSVDIAQGTPITTDTRAMLNMQGVTGISYIELRGGNRSSQPLTVGRGQKYPVIASSPSLLFRMDAAIDRLSQNVENITGSIGQVFNTKNGELLQNTLVNINGVSKNLKNNSDELNRIVKNADVLFVNLSSASHQIPSLIDNTQDALKNFKQLSQRLDDAADSVQLTLKQSNVMLQSINNQLLPSFMSTLDNIDGLTVRLDDFTQQLSDNPSMLIRGKAPAALGPGETRTSTQNRG